MNYNPVQNLSDSIADCVYLRHKPVKETKLNITKIGNDNNFLQEEYYRIAEVSDVEVYAMFIQSWGSTALGFDSIGGSSITSAYSIVIFMPHDNAYAVYFSGRFAYIIYDPNESFFDDIRHMMMKPVIHKDSYSK